MFIVLRTIIDRWHGVVRRGLNPQPDNDEWVPFHGMRVMKGSGALATIVSQERPMLDGIRIGGFRSCRLSSIVPPTCQGDDHSGSPPMRSVKSPYRRFFGGIQDAPAQDRVYATDSGLANRVLRRVKQRSRFVHKIRGLFVRPLVACRAKRSRFSHS